MAERSVVGTAIGLLVLGIVDGKFTVVDGVLLLLAILGTRLSFRVMAPAAAIQGSQSKRVFEIREPQLGGSGTGAV